MVVELAVPEVDAGRRLGGLRKIGHDDPRGSRLADVEHPQHRDRDAEADPHCLDQRPDLLPPGHVHGEVGQHAEQRALRRH
jgi:hypothetical protein